MKNGSRHCATHTYIHTHFVYNIKHHNSIQWLHKVLRLLLGMIYVRFIPNVIGNTEEDYFFSRQRFTSAVNTYNCL